MCTTVRMIMIQITRIYIIHTYYVKNRTYIYIVIFGSSIVIDTYRYSIVGKETH